MSIKRAINDTPVTAIGTSFATGKRFTVDMGHFPAGGPYRGYISLITAQVSSISSVATITMRVCRDAAGDECIITDTDATIATGVTTAADGTAIWALNADVALASGDDVYVFLKGNAGTFTCDYLEISWSTK
jgi:hypothetical protein